MITLKKKQKRAKRTKIINSIKKKTIKKKLKKESDSLNLHFKKVKSNKSNLLFNNLKLLFDSKSLSKSNNDGYEILENSKTLEGKQELDSDLTKQLIYSKKINMNSLLKLLMKAIYSKITTRDGFRQKRFVEKLCKQDKSEFLSWIKENRKYFKVLSNISTLTLFLNGKKRLECTNELFPKILETIIKYFLREEVYSFLIYEKRCEGEERNFLEKVPQLLAEIEKIP